MELPCQPVYVNIPSSNNFAESERLLLRPICDSDAAALLAIPSRPELAKTNHPKEPFKSIEETRQWMSSKTFAEGPLDIIGCSFTFAILDKSIPKSQEQLVGYVSVNTLDPCPEIGYSLLPESWGKGFATEALRMMLKMWWDLPRRSVDDCNGNEEKVYAICEKANEASCKVLRKCGFEVVSEFCFEGDKLLIWALQKC
ncbi:uncharacterized protein N7482_006343 [Penicillium canariense]|uniref:N-acetyltransferase domain-containing protein n=1 Tax=Penicillium canariense TaxID=189055 RepID=A0A9W9LND9_9EURO|nr:uncharacterized protein N7482_006343 [Penicillium canariense]KAJ5167562.1 hypothetical protein N7482_006343 [Penicillium canariense]